MNNKETLPCHFQMSYVTCHNIYKYVYIFDNVVKIVGGWWFVINGAFSLISCLVLIRFSLQIVNGAKAGEFGTLFEDGKECLDPITLLACTIPFVVGCFSGESLVSTPAGPLPLSSLRLGDSLLTYRPGEGVLYTQVTTATLSPYSQLSLSFSAGWSATPPRRRPCWKCPPVTGTASPSPQIMSSSLWGPPATWPTPSYQGPLTFERGNNN